MGTELCNCQNFFQKTENESNMLSNSKKEFSTIDKKNSIDKRFDEDSTTNEKYYKLKFGDINSKTNDTIDRPTNYIESTKKKGIFDINNSFDKENKENENKNNENIEKNQKENNGGNLKSPFKKTFTFKDTYMKSNGENNNTDKKNANSSNNTTMLNNNENNINQENQNNKINNNNASKKNIFNIEQINIFIFKKEYIKLNLWKFYFIKDDIIKIK